MAGYRLRQSGEEVQGILDNAAMRAQLTAETERAQTVEQQLQTNIESEATARQQADTTLQQHIEAEQTRAEGAEGSLQTAINNEAQTRQKADGVLDGKIAAEKIRAEGAEGALQTAINNETKARQQADGVIDGKIAAEKTRAEGAEQALQTAIDNEAKARRQTDGALDVSELNATENPHTLAKYVNLSAAIAAIPTDYQKGGMSIKFVRSSDNKYIQARCTANEFTTDITQWQGVDEEPLASSNLPKSGGVFTQNAKRYALPLNKPLFDYLPIINGHLSSDNKLISYYGGKCKLIDVSQNTSLKVKSSSNTYAIFLKSFANPILPYTLDYCGNGRISLGANTETDLTIPDDAKFALIEIYYSGDIDISVFRIDNIDYKKSQEIYYKDGTLHQLSTGINIFSADNIKPYLFKIDGIPAQTGNLESDGKISGLTSSAKYKIVPVYGGESLKLVSNYTTATRCLILSSIEFVDGRTPYYQGTFATGESRREGSFEITIPSDARYVAVQTVTYYGLDSYPVELLINGIALVENKDSIVAVDKNGNRVTRKFNNFTDYINQFSLGFGLLDSYVGNVGAINLEVTTYPNARYKKLIVYSGDIVTISGYTVIAILRSFPDTAPTTNIALDYAAGESRKSSLSDYTIPEDATCILVGTKDTTGNDRSVTSVIINGKEILTSKAVAKNQGEDYKNLPMAVNNSGIVEPYLPYKKLFRSYIDEFVEDCYDLFTEPCLCFPLLTDIHYMAKDSQGNLKYQNFDDTVGIFGELNKRLPLDFILCLGDIIDNNPSHYTTEELYEQAKYTTKKLGRLGTPYYPVIGNHDLRGDIFNLYESYTKGVVFGGGIGTSYYKDFDELGIRFISIDVYHSFLDFVTPLLNTDKVVIIGSHISAIATQNYSNDTFTGADDMKQLLIAFKENGGKLIQLFGHSHADYEFNTPTSPYLSICTACAQFSKPNTSYAAYTVITDTLNGITAQDRTQNTVTEQLFEVVIVRPAARKINLVRFGAGDSREFTF